MASECDFDNVTCVWSCNVYALVWASLKCYLRLKYLHLSFPWCFLSLSVYVVSSSRQSKTLGGDRKI